VTCHCEVSTIQFTQNSLRIKTQPNKGGNFNFLRTLLGMTPHSNATLSAYFTPSWEPKDR